MPQTLEQLKATEQKLIHQFTKGGGLTLKETDQLAKVSRQINTLLGIPKK